MSKEISQGLDKAEKLLKSGKLNAAIARAASEAGNLKAQQQISALHSVEDSYRAMRRYFLEGGPDASMSAMYDGLIEKVRDIIDFLRRKNLTADAPGSYYECLRKEEFEHNDLSDLINQYRAVTAQIDLAEDPADAPADLINRRYYLLDRIFSCVMVAYQDDKATGMIASLIKDADTDSSLLLQVISAVTLGLTVWYDERYVRVMIETAINPDLSDAVKARAAVGVIFALLLWPQRIASSAPLTGMLQILADSEYWPQRLRTVVKAVCSTRDTELVTRKMQDEVIPEIMKLRPDIVSKMKDFNPEEGGIENNPEWQEMLDKSGISAKLEELNEMMQDGADLMIVTFSQLKRFPFFDKAGHWFLPFDVNHPELKLDERGRSILDSICNLGGAICDSDKYSLALALWNMPQAQRSMVLSQFEQQFQQISEEMKTSVPASSRPDFDKEVTKAVREYYRYFKLARATDAFRNPFKEPVNPKKLHVVGNVITTDEFLRILAEFYMKRDLYREALDIFNLFYDNAADNTIYQKIGYCRQKTGDISGAREAYMKSELLGDSSQWLCRRLAYINRRLGNHLDALEYYNRALEAEPDNIKLILNAADMALQCNRPSEALRHLYHADYMNSDDKRVWRNIAWCELLAGHFDKSAARYDAILLDEPTMEDWLNAGHLSLLQGDFKNARTRYRVAYGIDKAAFSKAFSNDSDTLIQKGVNPLAINILIDEVES